MKLYIDDRFLSFVYEDEREKQLIPPHFTFKDASNAFMGGGFDARKIKKICFITKKQKLNFLYAGFLKDLLCFLKKTGISTTLIEDRRTRFTHQEDNLDRESLTEVFPPFPFIQHQISSLSILLKTNTGIIKAPTSAGKTEIMIAYLKVTRLPALILMNRISLVLQTADRLRKNGIRNVGVCHGKENTDGDVVVSTIQSVKKIRALTKFKVLIVDEVHRAAARTFQEFFKTTSFPLRFGFSATPETNDPFKFALIRQFLGDIIYDIDPETLIENEVIALPRIHFTKVECIETPTWPLAVDYCIVGNKKRNDKIKELVEQYNVPTLILIRYIDHGEELAELIDDSVFLSGIDDAESRREVIQQFEDGEINTIIATTIFNEGISINAIRLLIIASGGKSRIETIQRLGRALRVTEKKKEAVIYDFEDHGNYYTERHSRMRRNTYKKAGFDYIVE